MNNKLTSFLDKINIFNMLGMRQDIGIDLGTATVLIYVKDQGIVLSEPSVIALDKDTGRVHAVGTDAQRMIGRTPSNIVAVRPLRDGVISDYESTEKMLKCFLRKINFSSLLKPNIVICVPSGVTEVEERAVINVALQSGAGKAYVIEEPIAAAIGAGVDISQAEGNMIVDIGGGTTDIAAISFGGVVASASLKIAGDKFDEAIIKFIKKKYNLLIGERTAEDMKTSIGWVFPMPREQDVEYEFKGRNLVNGMPKMATIRASELMEALVETACTIGDAITNVIERTPPELVGDIASNGIILTGGGALLNGIDKLITAKTGIRCYVAENPTACVAMGTGKSLYMLDFVKRSGSVAFRKNNENL